MTADRRQTVHLDSLQRPVMLILQRADFRFFIFCIWGFYFHKVVETMAVQNTKAQAQALKVHQ